jgi:hypothetical protein
MEVMEVRRHQDMEEAVVEVQEQLAEMEQLVVELELVAQVPHHQLLEHL